MNIKNKQLPIMIGFSLGMFTLAVMFYSHVDHRIMELHRIEMKRQADFQSWSENICARGFSRAWIDTDGSYKAVCR